MGRLIFTFSDLTTTLDIDFGLYYRLDSLTLRGSTGHLQICPVNNNVQGNCEIQENLEEGIVSEIKFKVFTPKIRLIIVNQGG